MASQNNVSEHETIINNTQPSDSNTTSTDSSLLNPSSSDKSFKFAKSFYHEIQIMFLIFIKLSVGGMLEISPQFIGKIFVGHLPNTNTAILLSAAGLSQNYSNITGMSVGWGFTSPLFTLIPQCIGSNRKDLLSHYVQRSFYICLFILIISTIFQLYAGDILCFILGYNDTDPICGYINNYCITLIPFLYFAVWFTILQRVIQNLDYNTELLIIIFISNILTPFWNWLFVYYLKFGYLGTAITMDITMLCSLCMSCVLLIYKGYSYIFKPLSLRIVLKWEKVYEYLALSLPGLVQS